jgi:hypothetical protein
MTLLKNRTSLSALFLLFSLIFPGFLTIPALANQDINRNPWSLLETHQEHILQLSSDKDALAFFRALSQPPSQSTNTRITSRQFSKEILLPEEIRESISTYLASLTAIAYARSHRRNLAEAATPYPPSSEMVPGDLQRQWILQQSSLQTFQTVKDIYQQVSDWSQIALQPLSSDQENDFARFASYYDHTYPFWDDDPSSWTSMFEKNGPKSLEARLLEYWQNADQTANQQPVSPSIHQAYAQRYAKTRLLPIFKAVLLSKIIQLEASGYEAARNSWHRIQEWQQQNQINSAAARLCGNWQWLVHNHQNHGDHKAVITFSPPDEPTTQIQPSIIQIQGDTVYLKWTFPQGIQEDSLLLSNHDTHIEGTFKNSLGPHGSISGKRLSTCRS